VTSEGTDRNGGAGGAWRLLPLGAAALGAAALAAWLWLGPNPGVELRERRPGADTARGGGAGRAAERVRGRLEKGPGAPAGLPGEWPGFRGPNRDGRSEEKVALAAAWGKTGPAVLWSIPAGEGHAGPAVLGGRVYLLDYDATNQADVLRCLSLADGADIWRYSYPVKVKRNHGMSRTVPAVTPKYVVAIGPKCHVTCLDSTTGEFRWALDLVRDYGATVPPWYAGQCPLIDAGRVILAPGGDALLMAVECATGEVAWRTPNTNGWAMTHSSVLPVNFRGRRMYVYCGSGGVAGVAAEDGAMLWEMRDWKISIANVPSPVDLGDGRLFFSGGYDAGCLMARLEETNGVVRPSILWRLPAKDFGAAQQTPIFLDGYLYGVRPDGQLTCLAPDGALRWTSGAAHRFGLGPFLIAQGLIFVMDDAGVLTLARARPDGYAPLAEAKVLNGHDSWGPMALAGGRLFVRDLTTLACLDVSAGAGRGGSP
jgi:outer membrane protein assembly factor BamB